jgi:hypothetical protein
MCLAVLTGCGSTGGGSAGGGSAGGGAAGGGAGEVTDSSSPTPGCFASYVERGAPVPAAGISPRLTAARAAGAFVPPPDFAIEDPLPEGDSLSQQHDWASEGVQKADENPIRPPQDTQQHTQQELQGESDVVVFIAEEGLLKDYRDSSDPDYGAKLCSAIKTASNYLSTLSGTLNDANTVASYVRLLGTQPSNELASALSTAAGQFQQAFGTCSDNLDVAQWLLDLLSGLFCD